MRLGRFAVPIILISAIVLLGGVTAALVAAKSQPPRPATPPVPAIVSPAEATSTPTPTLEPPLKPVLGPTSKPPPKPTSGPWPKPTPKLSAERGPQSVFGATPQESSPPVSQTERSTEKAGGKGPSQGTVYTWQDGDRTMRIVLQDDLAVQKTAANTPQDVVVARGGEDSVVRKQGRYGGDPQPVFRSESGGGLMTLPGGVLLLLDSGLDQAKVESFFSQNEIPLDRVSELGFLENGFFVETGPGLPSLELANALAAQDGVLISSPNWWIEVEAK